MAFAEVAAGHAPQGIKPRDIFQSTAGVALAARTAASAAACGADAAYRASRSTSAPQSGAGARSQQ